MAKLISPTPQLEFLGVVTNGHPLARPRNSAKVCENFRVMPGQWLRLRSGRKARIYSSSANARFLKLHAWRILSTYQNFVHYFDGTSPYWAFLGETWAISAFTYPISTSYGGDFATSEAAPAFVTRDRVVFYNGLGVRDATNSRPPFSLLVIPSTDEQYFGLDAYCPNGNPDATFALGVGYNQVVNYGVQIFVGIHNAVTGHFSNGVYAGTIAPTGGTGTITVNNLQKLTSAYHGATEQSYLRYVFYATVDGGEVPYIIFNSTLTDIYTVPITSTSASLSLYDGFSGFVLNFEGPMPTDNWPPRPMSRVAYVNGRVYGIPIPDAGSGSAVKQQRPNGNYFMDFTYIPPYNRLSGIYYSKAASDVATKQMLGNPEESWPLTFWTPTPTSEQPIAVHPAPDGYRILVITNEAAFLVEEAADTIHEWKQISTIHGIENPETCISVELQEGRDRIQAVAWMTQRNQVALVQEGLDAVQIISDDYQSLLTGRTPRFGAYFVDPLNEVDRAEFFFSDGGSVCHDFKLRSQSFPMGQGYASDNQNYTAGARMGGLTPPPESKPVRHLIVAGRHLYTVEGQYDEANQVVTYDEDFQDEFTKVKSNFNGKYEYNWNDFGDDSLRKEISQIDAVCDDTTELEFWRDHAQVTDPSAEAAIGQTRVPQSDTHSSYRYQLSTPNFFLIKPRLKLQGDYSRGLTYDHPSEQGGLLNNFIGCIAKLKAWMSAIGGNRA